MSDDFKLYHKVMGTEIEMVMKVKTNSWVGIGWKPTGYIDCKAITSVGKSKPPAVMSS